MSQDQGRVASLFTDAAGEVPEIAQIIDSAGRKLDFWESDKTRPQESGTSPEAKRALRDCFERSFASCIQNPFLPRDEIRRAQFERIRYLVDLAYHEIPVYREKYQTAGFKPGDLRSWEDFERVPTITKQELIDAFPDRCVNRKYRFDDLYSTRSSGSSGRTLLIKVDLNAIVVDTLQGIRQFWLQSGLRYQPEHLLTHIYTVPWWFDSVDGQYPTAFISSLVAPQQSGKILGKLKPHVISCYPSNLKSLLPYLDDSNAENLYLVVTHSEQSSAHERRQWSKALGVPVLDEYSSEEATRMALELPCGHYHVCEDTVHLEVLDPTTGLPQAPGESGVAVITNLLNEAMPFIRYYQGDYVKRPAQPGNCPIQWSQLCAVEGRVNDSFVNRYRREIPAGTILDVTYRWMYDVGIYIQEFELVQKAPDRIKATFVLRDEASRRKLQASIRHLSDLLQVCMEHPVAVEADLTSHFPPQAGKRRPIRRDFPSVPPA